MHSTARPSPTKKAADMLTSQNTIVIRAAHREDALALDHLAQLDSSAVPAAPILVAEVNGALRAALSMGDGAFVADPFTPTAELVTLLEVRARQAGDDSRAGLRERFALWSDLWARARPGAV